MIKAYTLGFSAGGVRRIEVIASAGPAPKCVIRGVGLDVDPGLVGRLDRALAPLGIRTAGIEVSIVGGEGAKLPEGVADLAIAAAVAGVDARGESRTRMDGRLADALLLGRLGPEGELVPLDEIPPLVARCPERREIAIVPRESALVAHEAGASGLLMAERLEEVLDHLSGRRVPLRAPGPTIFCERCGIFLSGRKVYTLHRCAACEDLALSLTGGE
jgi:hypothetical protein